MKMKACKSSCPVNLSLESFGDKWSLLIIRDLMFEGKRSFRELLSSDEGIASNILSDRLSKLEVLGIIHKADDPSHKQKNIYVLTEAGIDLMPVLISLVEWSVNHNDINPDEKAMIETVLKERKTKQEELRNVLLEEYNTIKNGTQ